MKKRLHSFTALCLFAAAICCPAAAQTAGSSPSSPAPAGTTLADIIECGEGYTSHELYDTKITLVETIRGEDAWKRIREAGEGSKPADPGTEYLLARIRFEYHARGVPGLCIHPLTPDQFTAYSAKGEDYKTASTALTELRKGLKSGDSFEGWIAFLVSKEDKAPLLFYSVDDGGAVQHGGGKWFLLR